MPTTTGPIDRLHLLIEEPRNIRQGRGFPQCAVRRGMSLVMKLLALPSSLSEGTRSSGAAEADLARPPCRRRGGCHDLPQVVRTNRASQPTLRGLNALHEHC